MDSTRTKKHISTFIGGAIAGSLSFGIWPEMWKSYGIMGGFLTATLVIGTMWFMNHWLGVIENATGKLWVDQGFPIMGAGIAWGLVRFYPDAKLYHILPTLICCVIGGLLAGWAAHHVKQVAPGWHTQDKREDEV